MKATQKKILLIAINLLGYPLLILLAAINIRHIIEQGKSYGIFAYAGLIMICVFALVYFALMLKMKKRKKKSPMKQAVILSAVALVSLAGLWILIQNAAPNLLLNATSGTIYLEDLMEPYNERADINRNLLNDFIYANTYGNDNLVYTNTSDYDRANNQLTFNYEDSKGEAKTLKLATNLKTLKETDHGKYLDEQAKWYFAREMAYRKYVKLGYKAPEIKLLEKKIFSSINDDGYTTYKGPWIDMANGGRLTVPALIHLMLDERQFKGNDLPSVRYDGVAKGKVQWAVLDMMGPPADFHKMEYKEVLEARKRASSIPEINVEDFSISDEAYNEKIKNAKYDNVARVPAMEMGLEDILGNPAIKGALESAKPLVDEIIMIVETLIQHKNVVGSPIYVSINTETGQLGLISANVSRGTLGYQNAAWFNANGLTFMLSSVFSIRKLCLIFSGIIILITFATAVITQGKSHKEEKYDNEIADIEAELAALENSTYTTESEIEQDNVILEAQSDDSSVTEAEEVRDDNVIEQEEIKQQEDSVVVTEQANSNESEDIK